MTATQLKKRYSKFKIEYHRRYDGTYMLFGLDLDQFDWSLLGETNLPSHARQWSDDFDCEVPEVIEPVDPDDGTAGNRIVYADCKCCV